MMGEFEYFIPSLEKDPPQGSFLVEILAFFCFGCSSWRSLDVFMPLLMNLTGFLSNLEAFVYWAFRDCCKSH